MSCDTEKPYAEYNFTLYIGDSLVKSFTFEDANGGGEDRSDWEARMQLRTTPSSDTVVAQFDNAKFGGDRSAGEFVLKLAPTDTADIEQRIYAYDIEFYNSSTGENRSYVRGVVIAEKDVTRWA